MQLVAQSKCQKGKFLSGKVRQASLGHVQLDFILYSNVSWTTFSSWACRSQPDSAKCRSPSSPMDFRDSEKQLRQKPSFCRIKPIAWYKRPVFPLTRVRGWGTKRSLQQTGPCNVHISSVLEAAAVITKIINNENINLGMVSLRCKLRFKYKNDRLLLILLRKS